MLFHLFCEFADGSAKYLHLCTSSSKEAYEQAIQVHCASVVLFIICNLDPACELLGLDCSPRKIAADGDARTATSTNDTTTSKFVPFFSLKKAKALAISITEN
ncbi:MAG TPA: hypothetical protein DCP31_11825 [Cyanobacteria bacterium UBA8543]|nr:hypothetical protein [Cyanobacteria bacterium UBA8543]